MYVFIHLPKTGGNSIFNTAVRRRVKTIGHDIRDEKYIYFKDSNERKSAKFSFAFVRNPWDKLVSSYFYLKTGGIVKEDKCDYEKYLSGYSGFEDMILNWSEELFKQIHFKPQHEWICDDSGKLLPDFIGRFENIQEDFEVICDKIAAPKKKLPHKNKSKHKHYTEYYSDETQQIVAELYAKDIEYFGYGFGS